MRVLLDTNIVIHREAPRGINKDIGILYNWLDRLHYTKILHPGTVGEINNHRDPKTREAFNIKMNSYQVLQSQAPLHPAIEQRVMPLDVTDNDRIDSALLNEVCNDRVDFLITEDGKLREKASLVGATDRVFSIDSFLEKVTAENPGLVDYKVLTVRKELMGNINLGDPFFDSFREDYPGFDKWFNRKSEEIAYLCCAEEATTAFLYLKVEGHNEPYPEIYPAFIPKKRLKIGTFKVAQNGYKIGERFLKIIFDNAVRNRVDEIYVTIFEKTLDQNRLVNLLEEFGFRRHGVKRNFYGDESVFVRSMNRTLNAENPKHTYPFFSRQAEAYIVSIYPAYHTSLFPDSILNTESPDDFVEHEPFRNAISKVYICRSHFRNLQPGGAIVFYHTGGYYRGVVTTIGLVENVITRIENADHFIHLCRKRSVFSDKELLSHWNYNTTNRPFIVNFLYSYSFPRRVNMKRLIELDVISDVHSAPRGFERLSPAAFDSILRETHTDDRIIVD